MAEGSDRITVSRETLRAELTDLKIDLIDRINQVVSTKADESVVQEHDKRIKSLEESRAAREHMSGDLITLANRVGALERFRYAWPSIGILGVLIMFGTLAWYVFGAHH